MFGSIGIFEIVMVAGVALLVLGPEKFPEFAKLSMRTMRDVRKYISDAQRDIANELDPLKKEIGDIRRVDVEDYVDRLVHDDDDEDDDSTPYNPEPEPSVIDDWYPDEEGEKKAGDDETADLGDDGDEAIGPDEDSAQEYVSGSVPYDVTAGDDAGYIEEPVEGGASREEPSISEDPGEDDPERLDG